jgi:hypothetical protein
MYQWYEFKFRRGKNNNLTAQKSNSNTVWFNFQTYIYIEGVDVVEWSRALDVRLREWCCSVTMVWVQIPSREEQKFDSSKI